MLELSDEAIDYIEENSAYRRHKIPADTYEFLDKDIDTVTAYAVLMANTNTISEEQGYELAKAMVEHSNEITHAQGKQMTLENALNGSEGLPIHPGAAKYCFGYYSVVWGVLATCLILHYDCLFNFRNGVTDNS